RLALITMSSFSISVTYFYEELGFPGGLGEFSSESIMVNRASFKSVDVKPGSSEAAPWERSFGMDQAKPIPINPIASKIPVPYYSLYKNARFFWKKQFQVDSGIKELAVKVLNLLNTLSDDLILQTSWLEKNVDLVKECQDLAHKALLEPKNLNDLERLWAIGIWVALETGREGKTKDNIKIPQGLDKKVCLEIKAALHFGPTMTEGFEHWVTGKSVPIKANGEGLEECLKRAVIIGIRVESFKGNPSSIPFSQPIDKLVSQYLSGPELPQDTETVSKILVNFHDIFRNMDAQSWDGKYIIRIFEHMMHYWSYNSINSPLLQALQEESLWKHIHISLAKNDVIIYSDRLKQFLKRNQPTSQVKGDLYSVLRDPQPEHPDFDVAIKELLIELQNIPDHHLVDAYSLIMAHDFLGNCQKSALLSHPSWDTVAGLQRAWYKIYPGFDLGNVDVMDYKCHILLKNPHMLAHARWNYFVSRVQDDLNFKRKLSDLQRSEELEFPYDLPNNPEQYYCKLATMMVDHNGKVPLVRGLEMLMHLTNYLPKGAEYLWRMLHEKKFGTTVDVAIKHVKSYESHIPRLTLWPEPSSQAVDEIKLFLGTLSSGIHDYQMMEWVRRPLANIGKYLKSTKQIFSNQEGKISLSPNKPFKHTKLGEYESSSDHDSWRGKWPKRKLTHMKIGRSVFVFPASLEKSWAPFRGCVLEEVV
ncbi:hypothetical protein DFH28DRAFT_903372, partial [Melampsora americana]